jgi:hypothetical protein
MSYKCPVQEHAYQISDNADMICLGKPRILYRFKWLISQAWSIAAILHGKIGTSMYSADRTSLSRSMKNKFEAHEYESISDGV